MLSSLLGVLAPVVMEHDRGARRGAAGFLTLIPTDRCGRCDVGEPILFDTMPSQPCDTGGGKRRGVTSAQSKALHVQIMTCCTQACPADSVDWAALIRLSARVRTSCCASSAGMSSRHVTVP
jgi:hypothetical protein